MKLPSEYENVLAQFATAPKPIRDMWRYGMVVMLIEDGKMRIGTGKWNGKDLRLTVLSKSANAFKIVRPPITMEAEARLVEQTRELVVSAD